MRRIWKFELGVGYTPRQMPRGAKLRAVQMQGVVPTLWAEVDEAAPKATRVLCFYGTGHNMPADPGAYVGTVQDGPFVWHLYDEGEE